MTCARLQADRAFARRQVTVVLAPLTAVKMLATVRKLLTPTPAPIDIATRLESCRLAGS